MLLPLVRSVVVLFVPFVWLSCSSGDYWLAALLGTSLLPRATAMYPGSVLQLHQHATIVIDEDAASELTLVDYYKQTYANLPDWQRSGA